MNTSDKAVWVGWVSRMLLLALGGFFLRAGYSEDQVTAWLSGAAELIVGAAVVGLTMLWSWYRTKQDKTAAAQGGGE